MTRSISEEAYKEFVAALGSANVSTDPGVLETYTYMNGLAQGGIGTHWMFRPVCVTLPSNTEEVRNILGICAKYKLKFKAHSTAWIATALATCPRCVILDMRRMNNFIIDDTDAFAITESYATAGESQVEAMKRGFTPHLVGAGPNASNLASATSMQGTGGMSIRTSMNERNVLAVEWVTPAGEILRLGSLNTPKAGWFCGDGPGPSLRGMMRGNVGNVGGNGVFTRAAVKLYPWYGPEYKSGGNPPFFDSEEIPNSYLRYVVWGSLDKEAEGLLRLGEAEILDYNNRWTAGPFISAMSTTNHEYLEMEKKAEYKEKFEKGYWTFFMHGASKRAIDYRIKAFEKIISETGGTIYDTMMFGKNSYEIALQNAVKGTWIAKSAYMPTSANTGALPFAYETIDQCYKHALPISLKAKETYIAKDQMLNDGIDTCYVCIDEDGHYIHIEHATQVDTWEPLADGYSSVVVGAANALEKNLGFIYMSFPPSPKDMIVYWKYMAKIQRLLDPDKITDHLYIKYIDWVMPEEEM